MDILLSLLQAHFTMRLKKIFDNVLVKMVVLTILPFCIDFVTDFLWPQSKDWGWLLALLILVYVISLSVYGWIEHKMKKELLGKQAKNEIELRKELAREEKLRDKTTRMIFRCADKLYELVKKNKTHSDVSNWEWIEFFGDEVCATILDLVKDLATDGTEFAVSTIFKKNQDGITGFTMPSRESSEETPSRPELYKAFISLEDATRDKKFYTKLFEECLEQPVVLATKRDIELKFSDCKVEYSQYIGIPVTCTGNKMVGLIQIVAYRKSKVAINLTELRKVAKKIGTPCASLMLLCDKVENAEQILVKREAMAVKREFDLVGS